MPDSACLGPPSARSGGQRLLDDRHAPRNALRRLRVARLFGAQALHAQPRQQRAAPALVGGGFDGLLDHRRAGLGAAQQHAGGDEAYVCASTDTGCAEKKGWYGRLVGDSTALTPKHPVELAAQLKGPVLGLYGAADTGIPLDTVERMKAALAEAGAKGNAAAKASEFVVYPDAPHAFHADYRPSFRKEAAEDGWKRALAWFKQHGVG